MLIRIRGNLLESKAKFICHQVNCQSAMGSGVASQIRDKWPQVYKEYKDFCMNITPRNLLGAILPVDINEKQSVINMFSQLNYGYDGRRYTDYEAFATCLEEIHSITAAGDTIAFPRLIGCDRGGANWKIIETMIEELLPDREIEIYCLKGGPEECIEN